MEVRTIRISDLSEAEYNPRVKLTERDDEYQALKNSIESFGYVTPIIVNGKSNVVVGGHQRLTVLKSLGYSEVDCVVVDLDDKDERLLNVALNKIDGEWDFGELGELLRDMQGEDADLSLTGFSSAEIEDILDSFNVDDDEDPSDEGDIDCRIGEFRFSLTSAEYEQIVIEIKLDLGSQKQVIEAELSRRLLCSN